MQHSLLGGHLMLLKTVIRHLLNDLIDDLARMLGFLDNFHLCPNKEDSCRWLLEANGDFSVK